MADIYELWEELRNHPDFAGGAVFTRQDVAHAFFMPEGDLEILPTPEQVASITDKMLRQSRTTIDSYIFWGTYSWTEALRDNVDFSPLTM